MIMDFIYCFSFVNLFFANIETISIHFIQFQLNKAIDNLLIYTSRDILTLHK